MIEILGNGALTKVFTMANFQAEEIKILKQRIADLEQLLSETQRQLLHLAVYVSGDKRVDRLSTTIPLSARLDNLESERNIIVEAFARIQGQKAEQAEEDSPDLGETVTDVNDEYRFAAQEAIRRAEERKRQG